MNRSRRLRRCLLAFARGQHPASLRRFADPSGGRGEDGFLLLESLIAITLITIIMTALASFFLTTVSTSAHQRGRQAAAQLATTAVSELRALPSSDIVSGRGQTAATTQFSSAPSYVSGWLSAMSPAYDSTAPASAGATAAVPTAAASVDTINKTVFTTTDYLGWCWLPSGTTDCTNTAVAQASGDTVKYLRLVVAVTWTDSSCKSSVCSFLTATLISPIGDPTFNLNQTLPPAPIIADPGAQTGIAAGDTVDLQLGVTDGTGVPQFTWQIVAGALPAGLNMNTTGEITGTPTGAVTNQSVTVMVTDAFLRTDTDTFTWTVLPPLVIADPGAQSAIKGTAITPLTLTASGGSGTPYKFSDPSGSLPPGLNLATVSNKGTITGTPTTVGNYAVSITVTDSTNTRKSVRNFTWTVDYPPIGASNPGSQTDTVSTSIPTLQLSASGGSGNYSWSATGLPTGLSISSSGQVTGAATLLGSYSTTATVTDTVTGNTKSVTFTWSIVTQPTVTPSPTQTSVGSTVSQPVANSCPDGPCTFSALTGAPAGVSISPTGTLTGTVGGTAKTYTGLTVKIADADGATATSPPFSWTIVAAPTVTTPAGQIDTVGTSVSYTVAASASTAGKTFTLNNAPSWLTINSTTGVISGTAPSTVTTVSNLSVTVKDGYGSPVTSSVFSWSIVAKPTVTSPGSITTSANASPNLTVASTCPNGPCTYKITGGPSAVTMDSTGSTVGSTGNATTYSAVTITVKDADGVSNTSASFIWTVASGTLTLTGNTAQTVARGSTPSIGLAYACPTTACTVAITGAPSGLVTTSGTDTLIGLDSNGSGSAAATMTATSGLRIRGTVPSSLPAGTYTVTVTITDQRTVSSDYTTSATWTVI